MFLLSGFESEILTRSKDKKKKNKENDCKTSQKSVSLRLPFIINHSLCLLVFSFFSSVNILDISSNLHSIDKYSNYKNVITQLRS